MANGDNHLYLSKTVLLIAIDYPIRSMLCARVCFMSDCFVYFLSLTHWGRVTHICVSKQTVVGSDYGLSPARRQAIIWTNARILLIGTFRTSFSEILIEIRIFSFNKMGLNVSSA